MGLFEKKRSVPCHTRREPELNLPVSGESVEQVFQNCADLTRRRVSIGAEGEPGDLYWLDGMVKTERVSEYLICPLTRMPAGKGTLGERILTGGVWVMSPKLAESMDELALALVEGSVVLFAGGQGFLFSLSTEEKRSVSKPEVESSVKGAKDSFVESIRTNTSLVRRRLRTPFLRIERTVVGRKSQTPVELLWIDGLTNLRIVDEVRRRLNRIDIDGVVSNGSIEEYLTADWSTAFPQLVFTERPDRLTGGLLEGRAAILVDGIPCGYLVPGTLPRFLRAPQDKAYHYPAALALAVLRWFCLILTVFLPGLYVAMAAFQFELLPTKLMLSIIASKEDVPFTTATEVLSLLAAFEILQEAGLRLPQNIGQTVSIIGGLVVGQSAVDAKIVSPVVIIVVAVAGIAGYTMPDQDFANALRLWRFGITGAAALGGLFGLVTGGLILACHLSALEPFGVPYLAPVVTEDGEIPTLGEILRLPLRRVKLRAACLHPSDRRNQR